VLALTSVLGHVRLRILHSHVLLNAFSAIETAGEGTQWRISFSDGGEQAVWGPLPIPGNRRERDHRLQWRDDTDGGVYKDLPDGLTAPPELTVPPDV
jgi:hypothetical protein